MEENNVSIIKNCCNCSACLNICPKKAISVDESEYFYKIVIDNEECVNCGKCLRICPIFNPRDEQNIIDAYYGYHNDKNVLMKSSSGGVFHALSEYFLKQGGHVFGAAYSEDRHKVIFKSTDDVDLDELQKSKYVESLIGDTFQKIEKLLSQGEAVLFCGTPCQAAGLKNYLGKEYLNLLICDFSCGGLPSHKIYQQYLVSLERKKKSKVTNVDFRKKVYGWNRHSLTVDFANGKEYTKIAYLDPFFRSFIARLNKRDNCYHCQFSNNHCADLILADFWKYEQLSEMRNDDGISLILINSEKGASYFEIIKSEMTLGHIDINQASYNIICCTPSPELIEKHKDFLDLTENKSLSFALGKCDKRPFYFWIRQFYLNIMARRF